MSTSVAPLIHAWKPNPGPQEYFLSAPDKIKEILYGGALGGGKTEVLLHLPICRGWYRHPKFNAIYFRESFPELERSLIKRAQEIYPKFGGRYNGQKHCFTFWNPDGTRGGTIFFDYVDTKTKVHEHDTDEYNLIVWEELTAFEEYSYLFMFSRCRSATPELPAVIRAATNPGNIGHTWVRKRFVDPWREGFKPIEEKGTLRMFIPAKATDNPKLLENDPDYFNSLRHLPEAIRRAKIEGNWYIIAGQVFDEFRERHYYGEPENAVHVVKPFQIPEWWPKLVAIDWGYTAMYFILWAAVAPDGRIYIYREQWGTKTKVSEWSADMARLSQYDGNIREVHLDPSAWQNRGHEKNISELFQESSGYIPTPADNDRINGKMVIHEFLRWKEKPARFVPKDGFNPDTAQRILRMYGTDKYHEYCDMFRPEAAETNIPRLQIFSTCEKLIETIPLCVYNQEGTSKKKKEDVAEFDGDDPYDCLRYLLKAVDRFTSQSKDEASRREALGKILSDFEQNRDQTAFYRRMEHYERTNRKVVSIRRKNPLGLYGLARKRRA